MVRGHNAWALDQAEVQVDLARRRAATHANEILNRLERARGEVAAVLADPDLPATSRDRLQQMCQQVGILAYQEVKP